MKFILAASLLTTLFTNAFAQSERQVRDYQAIQALVESTKVLANNDLSCSDSTDCTVIAYGSRACGGANGFVITSKDNSNLAQIEALALESIDKESDYNQRYSVFSICSLVMPPQPKCVKKLCK